MEKFELGVLLNYKRDCTGKSEASDGEQRMADVAREELRHEVRAFTEDVRERQERRAVRPARGAAATEEDQLEQAFRALLSKIGIQENRTRERTRSTAEVIASNMLGACMIAPVYPLRLVQVLMQLGYEPIPPQRRYSIVFQRYLYYYPGVVGYAKAIVGLEGWRALYRGLGATVVENIVLINATSFLQPRVLRLVNKLPLRIFPDSNGDVPDTEENVETTRATFVRATKMFLLMSLTNISVEFVVHPFRVISIRAIAQHVGHEGVYNSIWGSVKEIYREEGISGLYAGLVPSLLSHVCAAAIHSVLWVFFRLFFRTMASSWSSFAKLMTVVLVEKPTLALFPRSYSYPLHLMSTVMAVNNCHLAIGSPPNVPVFHHWTDCYAHLRASHSLFRGSSWLFARFAYATAPKGSPSHTVDQ